MLTLLALLACSGSESDVKTLPPPPTDVTVVPPPPVVVAPTAGETRTLELDAAGGVNGAPEGVAFIVPGGAAEAVAGALSDGSTGMKLTATAEGDALMCTQSVPLNAAAAVGARMKVSDVKPGPQTWHGMNVELRARDATGALVSPPGSRYVLLRNDRAPTDWVEWELPVALPTGATAGEFCFRFVNSTGVVEVDKVVIKGVAPAATAAAAAVAVPSGVTRWELDAPGGGGGAPLGFDFLVPPGTVGTTAVAGPVEGGTGFKFEVAQGANSLACSQPFPVAGSMWAGGRVRIADVKSDGRAWTGFVAEVRTYNAAGALVSPQGSQFVPVATLKAGGDWQDIGTTFAAPAGAATGKLCFRFVESTGAAEVDWAGAGPG